MFADLYERDAYVNAHVRYAMIRREPSVKKGWVAWPAQPLRLSGGGFHELRSPTCFTCTTRDVASFPFSFLLHPFLILSFFFLFHSFNPSRLCFCRH